MDKDDRKLTEIRKLLDAAEEKIAAAKRVLFEQVYQEQAENFPLPEHGKSAIIEGVFDGENMIDKIGKKYPVPVNYSSKSKLVCGDNLKLTIAEDGTFIFKQIGPIERKRIVGKLSQAGDIWVVNCEGKKYLNWDIFEIIKNEIEISMPYVENIKGSLKVACNWIDEKLDCNSVRFIKSLTGK